MAKLLKSARARDALFALALGAALFSLLRYPAQAVEAARSGWELCGSVIIPSLFPFFVLSALCVELGLARYVSGAVERLMQPLFGVSGACAAAWVLGIIGGYPVGARTAIQLYESGAISRQEAQRLLAFCNNSGPAFILGVAGAGVFGSSQAGLLLYGAHIAASLMVGVLFRLFGGRCRGVSGGSRAAIRAVSFPKAFTGCVRDAFSSTLNICAFVTFFTVVIRMLFLTGLLPRAAGVLAGLLARFGLTADWAERLLVGAIELSSGVWSLSGASGSLPGKLSMAAFILGWAGLCVHCQVLSFLGEAGLSVRSYLIGKLLHGGLSAALVWGISRLWLPDVPVSTYLAREVTAIAATDFSAALRASACAAGLVWLAVVLLCLGIWIKATSNQRKSVV